MRLMSAMALALLAACGGSSAGSLTGHWTEQVAMPNQGSAEMTLQQSGTAVSGSGVQHREAGMDAPFTVSGTTAPVPGPGFTLTYSDGTAQGYTLGEPDANHFTLSASGGTRTFARQ